MEYTKITGATLAEISIIAELEKGCILSVLILKYTQEKKIRI